MTITESSELMIEEDRFDGLLPSKLNSVEKQSVKGLALALFAEQHRQGEVFCSPDDTRQYLQVRLAERKNEVFGGLFLDNRHRIIEMAELFQGTIDGAAVHPRVVVQKAMELNAAAIVFFHNHPSGVAEPSQSDAAITRRLKAALALVDVRILDHFVISVGESVSLAERGLL